MASHLAPENCFVCGLSEAEHSESTLHDFWSNTQAAKDFAKEPQGDTNVEARYVAEHWPNY